MRDDVENQRFPVGGSAILFAMDRGQDHFATLQDSRVANIIVGAVSEKGERNENQDSLSGRQITDTQGSKYCLLTVADGAGGHRNGDLASIKATETVTSELTQRIESRTDFKYPHFFQETMGRVINLANTEVRKTGGVATCTLLLVKEGEYWLANVGDSPCYKLDSESIQELTTNHSRSGMLTLALGISGGISQPAFIHGRITAGNIFVLGSDALSKYLTPQEIRDLSRKDSSPTNISKTIIETALTKGGKDADNCSALVVSVQ